MTWTDTQGTSYKYVMTSLDLNEKDKIQGILGIFIPVARIAANIKFINVLYHKISDKSGSLYVLKVEKSNVTNLDGSPRVLKSSAEELQKNISKWYKALRLFALVGLLSVLVYVGIRIIISSTGQEKAKYKKMIIRI